MNVADRQRPRPGELFLDHVSHFVPDLDAAARVLEQLGFCVTPLSVQIADGKPAGTANRCVMLETGYLEFLAPTADTPNAGRLRSAMLRYSGVHLCCFGTPDAKGEHQRLQEHGFDPQPLVHLDRRVESGELARFSVARPSVSAMPEGRVQFVQHHTPKAIWQPQYLSHENGAVKLACVFAVAIDPVAAAARWGHFSALLPRPAGAYVHLAASRGHVLVGSWESWTALLGDAPAPPALAGYALECRDPAPLVSRCRMLGLPLRRIRNNLYAVVLPEALGGSWLFGTRKSLGLPS